MSPRPASAASLRPVPASPARSGGSGRAGATRSGAPARSGTPTRSTAAARSAASSRSAGPARSAGGATRSASARSGAQRTPARARAGGGVRAAARRRRRAQRRAWAFLASLVLGAGLLAWSTGAFHHAVRELTLPLRHEDIIRQQAHEKQLSPALLAGVIYTESRFRDGQVSPAGAEGLMQITPDTAQEIARRSGGTAFRVEDLGTPQVNIAYGAFYLRMLLNQYGGQESLALAAYNAGSGNVDKWLAAKAAAGEPFRTRDIPFPETRAYVTRVESAERSYRSEYRSELGL